MIRNPVSACLTGLLKWLGRTSLCPGIHKSDRNLVFALIILVMLTWTTSSRAVLLWTDLGATQVHDTGIGTDILDGLLQRNDSSTDTLYFKFHVDPISDARTEPYFAAFQLFEGNQPRLAVGNALAAWAYSAFDTGQTGVDYVDLNSSDPEPSGIGTFHNYELVHSRIGRTIVLKVHYVPGGDDLVTVWLNPDLRPGATESSQPKSLTTQFRANASFDQIHLRQGGGGPGWVFSEMAIATSFSDFVNASGSGAYEESPFVVRSWEREQGLPENYVRALAQTRDGYIWVGTDEGVSRFDGVNFFSLGPQERFQGGPVQVLYGDSRGALWIGSANSGLSCWRGGKLRKFTVHDGLPSDSITALAEDNKGRIWVGTEAGLTVWRDGRMALLHGAEIFSGRPITTLFCDHRTGAMWVGAAGEGVFSYHRGTFVPLLDPALNSLLQDPHCLLVDRKERIWIGAGHAFVLCREGDRWRRFGTPLETASDYISALAEQPDGTIWAASLDEGLFEFKAGKLVVVNAGSELSDDHVPALLVDREGKLWVGTQGGLNRIGTRKVSILSRNVGLDYGEVRGLAEVRPGTIWAAEADGVYQWNGKIFRRLWLNQLPSQRPSVDALLAAQDGSCWVAEAHGLFHFKNPLAAEKEGGVPALTNLSVSALAKGVNGVVWAGTRHAGLWHFHDGKWEAQPHCPHGHPITAIASSLNGTVWIGTGGSGLYRIDGGMNGPCEKVKGLPGGWIRTLYLDAQGTLWIGTYGDGLSRLQSGHIATFTMREGLPDNTISQILDDGDGDLWMGCERGIFRVKKHDLDNLAAHKISTVYPLIYGSADGMLSEECSSGFSPAALRTKAGSLWFPTLMGIAVVDPQHIISSPPPAVVLEQVLVDGTPVPASALDDDINPEQGQRNGPTEFLRLPPGRHTLEFRYAGLSYDAPERVRFRYRLEGLDSRWVGAGTRREAVYNLVPPGTYHFQVIACNGDGVWNQDGASLTLTVLPHFWQTWWFIAGGALCVGMVGAGSVRLVEKRRSRRRFKQLEQEQALERERTRIAQDLHDMMGSRLCRISFLSEHVRRSQAVPGELLEEIRSMSNDSREVLQSLDEIVWAVNPQKDSLEHLASYIGQYAREYFRKTGIECEVEAPVQLPARTLSSQTRHHIFLAVREALANILKHSRAARAKITMTCRGSDFEIMVSDDGIGFDPAASKRSSPSTAAGFNNGLDNMCGRMTELGCRCMVESRPGQGTIIRFILSFNNPAR
jgi:ligand-binding sensor domain-containing protein/signal transduction histidine kinase